MVAALAVLTLSPTTGAAADGSVSIALADAPSGAADPRAAFYVVDHVQPGDTLERTVAVGNSSTSAVDVALSVGGASIEAGRLVFDEPGASPAELQRWSTVEPSRVALPAGGRATVAVRVSVPSSASSGERLGVIWAELPPSGGETGVVNRVGVRIYLSVGSENVAASDFRVESLTASRDAAGAAVIVATIRNTGDRLVEPAGSVDLDDGAGASAAFAPGLALLPGEQGEARATFADELADGPWALALALDANGVTRQAQANVTFPADPGDEAEPVVVARDDDSADDADDGRSISTVPVVVAVVLAAVVLIAAARRRRAHNR